MVDQEQQDPRRPFSWRRLLQFRLRTLLIVMLLLGVLFGYLAIRAQEVKRQRAVVADLRSGGAVLVERLTVEQLKESGRWEDESPQRQAIIAKHGFGRFALTEPVGFFSFLDTGYLGRVISVRFSSRSPSDISALKEMKNLEQLDLSHTQVAEISALSNLKKLKRLNLWDTPVRDISPLSKLTNLESLFLLNTQVNDLSALSKLTNLRSLSLNNTQVSDLSPLIGLKNLISLDVLGTPISKREVEQLRQSLPGCKILSDCE